MDNDRLNYIDDLEWTPEAEAKLKEVPFFVRRKARQRIEAVARAVDSDLVTADIVEQARSNTGQ